MSQRMGDIAALDAYDVPGEQSTGVGWANRAADALFAPRQYDESTLYPTASPLVNISEGDIGRATEAAMGVSGGGLSTKGIKAYHSSPHDFDKFDLAKIGSGEGAQVYGHGLYFAENPAVSGQGGQYWNQFLNRFEPREKAVADTLRSHEFNRSEAIEASQRDIRDLKDMLGDPRASADKRARWEQILQENLKRHELLTSGKPVGPRTYEVNIAADPAHMLDWDKALKEQGRIGEVFRDVVPKPGWWSRQMGDIKEIRHSIATDPERAGSAAYGSLARMLGQPRASAALREAGIPGIKYLDQGSRNARPVLKTDRAGNVISSEYVPPTSNYVIFDPNIIDIMKKYGIAGAAPAGMGALAAQDTYNPEERL